jgi:ActR/RegA family two-component response regulator
MSKNKPGKALNVLIIDDDTTFIEGLQRNANPFRIRLEHATNLEDGLLKLQERGEKFYVGVILDVICLKDRKQQIPDPSFISKAMEEFNRLAPSLPKVILTGEPTRAESLKPIFAGNTSVYHKSAEQIEEMLTYFVKQSENLPRLKFAKKYPDIFSLFDDGHLGPNEEQALVACLEKFDHYEATVISDNLGRLRKLQEAIYLAINKINPEIVPMSYIEKNGPNCRSIMRHLKTKRFVEETKIIDHFSDAIYSISSDYGVHVPNTRPEYPPTRYTVQALNFAMLDQLLWFKGIVEKR